ncbi:hypothetical protein SAMN05421858_0410 [Haladaptatus litoreus]|uniref:Uncharacterized protein n=1 Tax=Haladaptatus litoreus TaxID=553468 RepID=A0A1N6VM16_9EURY|nr:hypothetical protein SAMN05421858_0410 [Haladaptatus litoreus]
MASPLVSRSPETHQEPQASECGALARQVAGWPAVTRPKPNLGENGLLNLGWPGARARPAPAAWWILGRAKSERLQGANDERGRICRRDLQATPLHQQYHNRPSQPLPFTRKISQITVSRYSKHLQGRLLAISRIEEDNKSTAIGRLSSSTSNVEVWCPPGWSVPTPT